MTEKFSELGMPNRFTRFCNTCSNAVPITMPRTEPSPPRKLHPPSTAAAIPYIDVEAFGVLLREGVNYDCGDSLLFVVEPSGVTRSGYETIAYFRRATTQ